MAYNRALDLVALALEATIAKKPQFAAKMLAAAAKDPSAASAVEAVIAANKQELTASGKKPMRRRSLSLLQRRIRRAGVEPEAELEGDDLRVEVDSEFDDELMMDDDLGVEDFAKTVKFETKSAKKKTKAEDEDGDDDEEDDKEDEKDEDEDEDEGDEEKAAAVARMRRALANLSRRQRQ